LELKDKFAITGSVTTTSQPKSASHDILNALLALGYNDREALLTVKQLPAGVNVADGIKQALQLLSK
jgi:Holliday junction DNA helicase RuvA